MSLQMKIALTSIVMAFFLTGCERQSVFYEVTTHNHTFTLIREKAHFWSDHYSQYVVIANVPNCQRRYRLQTADTRLLYDIQIYDYGHDTHLWIVQNQYYLFDHIDCTFTGSNTPIEPPLSENAHIGEIYVDRAGKLTFRDKRIDRMPEERARMGTHRESPIYAP